MIDTKNEQIWAIDWLFPHPELSLTAKIIYIRLRPYARNEGYAYISQGHFAKENGISLRSMERGLRELRSLKLIILKREGFPARGNYYFPHHPWMDAITPIEPPKHHSSANMAVQFRQYGGTVGKYSPSSANMAGLHYNRNYSYIYNYKIKKIKQKKEKKTPTLEIVTSIFKHWQTVMNHPRAQLDDKRKRLIRNSLSAGYLPDDLKLAIDGCMLSPFNMGDNPRGQRYDDLGLILRDADHIDRFIAVAINPPVSQKELEEKSEARKLEAWKILTEGNPDD